ncbi:MAG: ATP-binding protein [Syntrophobacteraceae bacterium]
MGNDKDELLLVRTLLGERPESPHEVDWVNDYVSALENLGVGQYDVCLLADRIGARDGLQLLVEATARQCSIPVIVLSAKEDYEADLKAMRAGAVDFLVKSAVTGPLLERSIRYAIERRRTESALRKSEEKYRGLVEKASSIIMRLDSQGRIVFINEFTEAFFGCRAREVEGLSIVGTFVPPIDSEGNDMAALLRNVIAQPESYTGLETEVLRKDAGPARVVWTNRALQTPEGELSGFLAVGTDVTDQRRAEPRISLDDACFDALFQLSQMTQAPIDDLEDYALEQALRISGSSLGFVGFLDEHESQVVSTRWCNAIREEVLPEALPVSFPIDRERLWGLVVGTRDVVTINDWQATHGEDQALLPEALVLHRLLATPVFEDNHIVAITVVGNKEEPYEDSDARHLGLLMSSMWRLIRSRRDRDALSQSEQQLRETNTLLQKVFDGIAEPLIMINKDYSVGMVNKAARRYYGLDSHRDVRGELCYQALCKLGHPCEECDSFLSRIDVPAATFERRGIFDPGRIEQVVIYSVYSHDGAKDASIVRISDMTEQRTIQKQLVQSEKLASLGLLVSGITHEINNPNTFISFNLPILRDYLTALMPIFDEHAARHPDLRLFHMPYPRFRADLFKLLDNMEHGTDRISGIVSRLKSFLRKRDRSELLQTDVIRTIEQTISIAQPEIRKRVKSFHVILPDGLPEITTDPEAIQQVVLNLLINAAHACDKLDSEVTLRVGRVSLTDKNLFVEVRDNGTGMDDAVKKRIFDPFFTTKGPTSGTGLGLYISYNLLHNLGGRIDVDSTPGLGSTFRITLTDQGTSEEP